MKEDKNLNEPEQKVHTDASRPAKPKQTKRYRLLFLNEREEKIVFSVRLYTWVAALLLTLLIALTSVLVVLIMTRTPLKSFLPGYLDMNKKTELVEATLRLDSLERESALRAAYLTTLTDILSGRIEADSIVPYSSDELVRFTDSLQEASAREQAFTAAFEEQERYSLNSLSAQSTPTGISFIAPLKGTLLPADSLRSVQVGAESGVCVVNELRIMPMRPYTVMAPADGVVVAVSQAPDGTFALMMQHVNDCITELNHLTSVWVSVGQNVRTGSVVAQAATEGKEPTWVGFRIWQRGASIDPQQVVIF